MSKIPCAVGILTRNSAATLPRALESVKDFAEIIICDSGSTDETRAIAKEYGARVIEQDKKFLDSEGYIQDFSGVRNQTLAAATHEWFFYLDSDEEASPELVASIRRATEEKKEGAFIVLRRYVLRGKEVTCSASYPNRSMRFFSKRSVLHFRKIVHERPELRDGVVPEYIEGALLVPVEEDRAKVRKRNDRYIALEVRRKGRVGFFRFLGYVHFELRSALAHAARLVRSCFFCQGVRLPLSMELARFQYPAKLLRAIWRARKASYPPTVLFLTNKWKTGGAEHVFLQEYEAFRTEGISARFGSVYGGEVPPGVEERFFIGPRFQNLFDIPAYVRLISALGNEGVTHVVATLEHAMITARISALFAPSVKVFVVESGMAERKPLRYKLLDVLLNWRTTTVVAGSSGVRDSLLRYQSLYRRKMAVLLNGVAVPTQVPPREEPQHFTILAVGSLRSEKGFDVLLSAFAQFRKDNTADAELVILGKGHLEESLKEQARALGVADAVRFAGEQPHAEALAWYRRCHCFVLSSRSEGNPTVVMEALAQGAPVIATRVSGVTDYLEDGLSGLLVPIDSPEGLAAALGRLYADPALRERISAEGYALAKGRLSFEGHIDGLKKVLFKKPKTPVAIPL